MLTVIIISKKVSSCFRRGSEPWGMTMDSPGNDFGCFYMTSCAIRAQNRSISHFRLIPAVFALEGISELLFVCG